MRKYREKLKAEAMLRDVGYDSPSKSQSLGKTIHRAQRGHYQHLQERNVLL